LPVLKITLELTSSDAADVCLLAAAHGKTGRGAAEIWGKGKQSRLGPSSPVRARPGRVESWEAIVTLVTLGIGSPWGQECVTNGVLPRRAFGGVLRKPRYAEGSCGPRGLLVMFVPEVRAPNSVPALIPALSAGHLLPERSG